MDIYICLAYTNTHYFALFILYLEFICRRLIIRRRFVIGCLFVCLFVFTLKICFMIPNLFLCLFIHSKKLLTQTRWKSYVLQTFIVKNKFYNFFSVFAILTSYGNWWSFWHIFSLLYTVLKGLEAIQRDQIQYHRTIIIEIM